MTRIGPPNPPAPLTPVADAADARAVAERAAGTGQPTSAVAAVLSAVLSAVRRNAEAGTYILATSVYEIAEQTLQRGLSDDESHALTSALIGHGFIFAPIIDGADPVRFALYWGPR
jgi:hypothetical protein